MKTITIQKISYNEFSVDILCYNCSHISNHIIRDINTLFPYKIKEIIENLEQSNPICPVCNHIIETNNIGRIIVIDQENIVYELIYSLWGKANKKIHIISSIFKGYTSSRIPNNSIILIKEWKSRSNYSNKNFKYTKTYTIKNEYINFVVKGWIKSFKEARDYILYRKNTHPQKSVSKDLSQTHKIKPYDIIIISDLRRCANQNHNVKDVTAILYTVINEHKQKQYINASFCFECCRYTISQSEFNNIEGKPICQIEWHNNSQIQNNTDTWDFNTQHSILYKLGYNVQKQSGLSADVRRKILTDIIKNRKLSKSQICSYLEMFIKQKRGQPNMKEAVSKWKSDLQYIRNLKVNTSETIEVKKLIKK